MLQDIQPIITLNGAVTHGNKQGRVLGFPTLNCPVQNDVPRGTMELPQARVENEQVSNLSETLRHTVQHGVYSSLVKFPRKKSEKVYLGVTSIRKARSTEINIDLMSETHILAFNEQVYLEPCQIVLLWYLRPNRKMSSVEELQTAIQKDIDQTKQLVQPYLKN